MTLRATLDDPAFAAIDAEFLAELPEPLTKVLAVVEAAHSRFDAVNPWNTDDR